MVEREAIGPGRSLHRPRSLGPTHDTRRLSAPRRWTIWAARLRRNRTFCRSPPDRRLARLSAQSIRFEPLARQAFAKLSLRTHGEAPLLLRLPELRRDHAALAGQVRSPAASGTRSSRRRRPSGSAPAAARRGAAGRPFPLEDLTGEEARAAHRHRHRGTRPRGRRRLRARLGDADRRRARHRQVHPADPGLRGARARRRARRLRFRRGVDRPGAPARCAPRARRRARSARRADTGRGHRPTLGSGDAPTSSSSIRSRRCGATPSNWRRER